VLSRSQPYRSESHGVIARRSAAADPQSIVPLAQEPACLGYCAGVEPAGTESVPRAWRGSAVYAEHLLSLDGPNSTLVSPTAKSSCMAVTGISAK
jgi:hypothetical protein